MKTISEWKTPAIRDFSLSVYKFIDRNGLVSDFFADPQQIYERWWPYKAIRRYFLPNREPLISVVVATRNNETIIERSLRSLLSQTFRNVELIVVDDASTDNSVEIIKRVAATDSRIKLLVNSEHLGISKTRNRGILQASGDYLTFQDGDDISIPTRLEMQYDALRRNPHKILSLCNYVRVTETGRRLNINNRRVMKCIISMMFPRRLVLEKVGFFDSCDACEDTDYYERIKIVFGPSCEIIVFRTLYEALFRPQSAFFSTTCIEEYDGQNLTFRRTQQIQSVLANLKRRHDLMRKGHLSVFCPH